MHVSQSSASSHGPSRRRSCPCARAAAPASSGLVSSIALSTKMTTPARFTASRRRSCSVTIRSNALRRCVAMMEACTSPGAAATLPLASSQTRRSMANTGGRGMRRAAAEAVTPRAIQSGGARFTASATLKPWLKPAWNARGNVIMMSPASCSHVYTCTPDAASSAGGTMVTIWLRRSGDLSKTPGTRLRLSLSKWSADFAGTPYHRFGAPAWSWLTE
mmetsp:Transcript_11315/g.33567  ORF Transcript_11315/g.33567 Transcript_11315/m.33567 type:complete len:218 (-) Transcript_11315:1309-1962(-)